MRQHRLALICAVLSCAYDRAYIILCYLHKPYIVLSCVQVEIKPEYACSLTYEKDIPWGGDNSHEAGTYVAVTGDTYSFKHVLKGSFEGVWKPNLDPPAFLIEQEVSYVPNPGDLHGLRRRHRLYRARMMPCNN